jgi:hypothetical protein
MRQINSDLETGILKIHEFYDVNAPQNDIESTPYFDIKGKYIIIDLPNLYNVKKITKFSFDTLGSTDNRYLETEYRISRNGSIWSEWFELKNVLDNFPEIDPGDPLLFNIRFTRDGFSEISTIRLLEYSLEGVLERNIPEITGENTINIKSGETIIWKTPYIYKVFKISDLEILSNNDLSNVEIKYRYSQDNSRSWSNWELLTKENITTTNITPIRFFQIEYSITNNSNYPIGIQDINLIGEFQNVSKDYFKTNLYGIRDCCISNLVGYFDNEGNYIYPDNGTSQEESNTSVLPQLSDQDKANLFQPYQQNRAMDLLEKMSVDAEAMFGHNVVYYVTDPDVNGQDHTIHEYQLYNISCEGKLKVGVEDNRFPDSQIVMNQFDLSLFESMTVHITKKQFKEIFGPQRRPSKEDIIYFCDINRMFIVDHAQQFRNFNNAAIYYKLVLKKYNKKANVKTDIPAIENSLDKLTKNSTIEELMGIDIKENKDSVANKQQHRVLSDELIRLEYKAVIEKELIENSDTIISKANYDLSTLNHGEPGVRYKNLNPVMKVSDNIGYYSWFRINNYVTNENYNMMKYYDDSNSLGFMIDIIDDSLKVTLNSDSYNFDLLGSVSTQNIALEEDIWYCLVVNIDQRNRKLNYYVYKRNVSYESDASMLSSNILKKVYEGETNIISVNYELEEDNCSILASDMSITNIRLFSEIIPEETHNKILNQYIIRDDSKHLIFADNATTRIYTQRFPYNE